MGMSIAVRVCMLMIMGMAFHVLMIMPMALSTLMVMPLFLQMHIKIIRIQPAFYRPAKMEMVSLHAQAAECPLQNFSVGAKIQKRSDRHISANSRITFQIQYFPHLFHRQSVYLCCQIACAVSIIDIYHGNPVRAGIQHSQ